MPQNLRVDLVDQLGQRGGGVHVLKYILLIPFE